MKFLYMIVSWQGFSSHSNKFLQHSAAKLLKQRQNMIKASDSVLRKTVGTATSFRKAQVPSEVKASKVCPMYNVCPKYVQSMSKVSPVQKRQPLPKNNVPRNSQLCWWAAMRDQLRPTTPISWFSPIFAAWPLLDPTLIQPRGVADCGPSWSGSFSCQTLLGMMVISMMVISLLGKMKTPFLRFTTQMHMTFREPVDSHDFCRPPIGGPRG